MIRSFAAALEVARTRAALLPLAVVAPEKPSVLELLAELRARGASEFLLVGDAGRIEAACGALAPFEVEHAEGDPVEVCQHAVGLVRAGRARGLMKGHLPTASFLKGILRALKDEADPASRPFLSHGFFFEFDGRLMVDTDGGMNPQPTLEEKGKILRNAVAFVRRAFGVERPKVAVMAASEKVIPGIVETEEAAALAAMNRRGEFEGCIVDGPLALDNVLSPESAREKGIESPALPDTDILLMPTMAAGNLVGKCIAYLSPCPGAGLILGAPFPIVMLSRTDGLETRTNSIALSAL